MDIPKRKKHHFALVKTGDFLGLQLLISCIVILVSEGLPSLKKPPPIEMKLQTAAPIKFFKNIFIIYLWLHWVFIAVCRLSLIAARGGYSLVAVHGLLITVASLVAEHGL